MDLRFSTGLGTDRVLHVIWERPCFFRPLTPHLHVLRYSWLRVFGFVGLARLPDRPSACHEYQESIVNFVQQEPGGL
jgi:hypothetical protein